MSTTKNAANPSALHSQRGDPLSGGVCLLLHGLNGLIHPIEKFPFQGDRILEANQQKELLRQELKIWWYSLAF